MLESFANGTPIMSFKLGGMKDWVINKENGILVDELTSECFAKELINFADNKYTFDEAIIKEYAMKNFNQISQTEKYIKLYKSILKIK